MYEKKEGIRQQAAAALCPDGEKNRESAASVKTKR